MDRTQRCALASALVLLLGGGFANAAGYRTQNFIVTAATQQLAQEIGDAAEHFRQSLAVEWLGKELSPWTQPCPITVQLASGAGGATSFMFDHGRPFGWRMSIQGSRERLLDSVLPHEITHTIFATHFGRPLPRWADEGACTTVEHESEKARQEQFLLQFLRSSPPRSIPFNAMFRMTEYPHDILPLYAQGHSVARYLIQQGGKRKFVDYVGRGMQLNNWDAATDEFYGYRDLSELQVDWINWVAIGSPQADIEQLASAGLGPKRFQAATGIAQVAATTLSDVPRAVRPSSGDADYLASSNASQSVSSVGSWYAQQQRGQPDCGCDATPQAVGPPASKAVAQVVPAAGTPAVRWLPGSARLVAPTGFVDRGNVNSQIAQTQNAAAVTSESDLVPIPREMARPQPTGQPQQTVLQWDRGPSVAVGPGVELRRSAGSDPIPHRYDAPLADVPAVRR